MKVCVLATSYPRNRDDHASVFVHGLSKGLAKMGNEVFAIVPHEKGLVKEDSFDGVKLHRFTYFWPRSLEQVAYGYGIPENIRRKIWAKIGLPFFLLAFFFKSWRLCKNCDVIHAHWEISALIGLVISRRRKIPVVLTVHRIVARNRFSRWCTQWLLSRLDMLHFNSSYTLGEVQRLLGKDISYEIIYPSVDIDFFKPGVSVASFREKWGISQGVPVLLGLGRLVEKKGFRFLIEAFSKIQKGIHEGISPILVIAGGGPLLGELQEQAQKSCKEHTVIFTDFMLPKDIVSLLREVNLMVAPSIMDQHGEVETLGTVLMEAMACGVPVIGTRLGGIPDVIENQVSGILVEPKNSEELAQTILQVLKRPKFCEKLSKGGLQRVRSAFSWDIAVQATLKSYQGLLKNDIRV